MFRAVGPHQCSAAQQDYPIPYYSPTPTSLIHPSYHWTAEQSPHYSPRSHMPTCQGQANHTHTTLLAYPPHTLTLNDTYMHNRKPSCTHNTHTSTRSQSSTYAHTQTQHDICICTHAHLLSHVHSHMCTRYLDTHAACSHIFNACTHTPMCTQCMQAHNTHSQHHKQTSMYSIGQL